MSEFTTQKAQTADRPAQAMKDFAQQGADYSKDLAEKSEAMADATKKSMQQTYSTAVDEAANFNVQWIEMLRENANASLDLARQLVTAKSPSEFFELSAAHTRKQMETFAQQAQQLAGLAQKATADAMKPMQAGMKNVFNKAA
jgi:phasin